MGNLELAWDMCVGALTLVRTRTSNARGVGSPPAKRGFIEESSRGAGPNIGCWLRAAPSTGELAGESGRRRHGLVSYLGSSARGGGLDRPPAPADSACIGATSRRRRGEPELLLRGAGSAPTVPGPSRSPGSCSCGAREAQRGLYGDAKALLVGRFCASRVCPCAGESRRGSPLGRFELVARG